MAANGLKTNIYRLFKPLAAIQFWLVQLLIPETRVMAFELLYLAKYFQNFSYFISKVSKNWWLSHYNCSSNWQTQGGGQSGRHWFANLSMQVLKSTKPRVVAR